MKNFRKPNNEHLAKLGKMEAHIQEVASHWSESGIRVKFTSDSEWLLTPDTSGIEKEASPADKMVAIIKRGLSEEGMVVVDDRAPDTGLGYGTSDRFSHQLQTDTMHSFYAGDDGIIIRAAPGRYPVEDGIFNAAVIAAEANNIVDRMAHLMKDAHTADKTAEIIGRIYNRMEVHGDKVSDLLAEIPNAHAADDRRNALIEALAKKLPAAIFADAQHRTDALAAIAQGISGSANQPAWPHTDNEEKRASGEDPLHKHISAALVPHLKSGTSEQVSKFMTSEASDAVYSILAGHHASHARS